MHFLIFLLIFTEQPPRRDLLRLRVHFLLPLLRAAVEAAGEEDRRLGGGKGLAAGLQRTDFGGTKIIEM